MSIFFSIAALAGCVDVDEPVPPPSIAWVDCSDNPAFDCGTLLVPMDHADPFGPKFQVPVVRARALDPSKRMGSLVVNPGGPGGSGVQLAKLASYVIAGDLRDRFDIVGFDPRGEARSRPAIDCLDDLDAFVALDTTPDDAAEEKELIEGSRALADGCEERVPEMLRLVGTNNIVRDMDLLREALGDEKLTYLGFSYGTFLGAVYAETFPDKVRALVLDGALDPALTSEAMIEGQARAFESELGEMLAWCSADDECPLTKIGGGPSDPTAVYDAVRAAVEAEPLPAPSFGKRVVGPGEFSYGVTAALYQPQRWPELAGALTHATKGDGSALLALADSYTGRRENGGFENDLEVYYAVTSIDATSSRDPAKVTEIAGTMRKEAPRIGAYLPYSVLPSEFWPVPPWRESGPVSAPGAPPILVIGGTRDPATPYVWSKALSEQLPGARLLTRDGDGHTSFLKGNTCIDAIVVDYLVDSKLPDEGTICEDEE